MNGLEYTPIHDIPGIIDNTRNFYKTGSSKDLAFRKHQLEQMVLYLKENQTELENAICSDIKRHRIVTLAEMAPVINECNYLINNLNRLVKPVSPKKWYWLNVMDTTYTRKEPKGIVLIIVASHTAAFLTRTITNYLDRRSFKIINGGADETNIVLDHPFDHIFYTGGNVAGKIVLEKAAKFFTPVTLELGGKSPVLIAPDTNHQEVANRVVFGKFLNNGQTCVAPDYILVQHDHAESLIKALRQSIRDFFGDMPEKSDSYGRIINLRQFDRLKRILDGVDPKTVVIGGQCDEQDLYIAPTVVYPASVDGTEMMDFELFGPILPVVPVDDIDEAIKIINAKPHPLVTYIFSNQRDLVNKVIEQTTSGGVLVNDTLVHTLEASLPFGGVGASGMGNYHGDYSFNTFSHERSVMIKPTGFEHIMTARYPPFNQDKYYLFETVVYGLPSCLSAKLKTIKCFFESLIEVLLVSSSPPKIKNME
ncbi:Aldehyde/histidinol dehydrogenase [Chlamydoabsidia padenii]|nr:Aldehyde/histidinol dehydrogenase [Chlamydoabsidia padenii]